MFVFDAMPLAEKTVIYETKREEEFSPIKNKEGADSLPTSLHDQVRRWAHWLERAGVSVPRDADGQIAAAIEISPLFADSAEALAEKLRGKSPADLAISPGQNFYLGSRGQIGGSR
jgi:UDP-N-acetylglucosamine/UDP-N-acetylgalactosamine diphosphorylase